MSETQVEKFATLFAWRAITEDYVPSQWEIDAVFMRFEEVVKLWKALHGDTVELRKIEVDFSVEKRSKDPYRYDTPHFLRDVSPIYKGWWRDPFTRLWVAPDEFIETPTKYHHDKPISGIAVAFLPQGAGWIHLQLASHEQSCKIWLSSVYDPMGDMLEWLSKVWNDQYARFSLDEEGSEVEFHAIPSKEGYLNNDRKYIKLSEDERRRLIDLVIVRKEEPVSRLLLHVCIDRKVLVRSIYSAFLLAQINCSHEMQNWPYHPHRRAKSREENLKLKPEGPVFCRSPFLDEVTGL